jgi:hypothetical protein
MAQIENIARTGESLRDTLDGMDEPELMAQQIVQQGAVHALETLLTHGCAVQTVHDMLASLRSNMLVIEAVARAKGFARLFAESDEAPRVPHPAEIFHEAALAILGDLMHADPAVDSPEGRVLLRLADAVEAYEKVMYPMPPASDAAIERSDKGSDAGGKNQ